MKIEFKDVAHMYLGCRVEMVASPWFLNSVDRSGRLEVANDTGKAFFISNVKPILRPLKSITDEEIIECRKASNVNAHGCVKDALQTNYLLSKHFDLFNLIESGQAIDRSTLSTPSLENSGPSHRNNNIQR